MSPVHLKIPRKRGQFETGGSEPCCEYDAPDVSRNHVLGVVKSVSREASRGSFLSEDITSEDTG